MLILRSGDWRWFSRANGWSVKFKYVCEIHNHLHLDANGVN